MYLKSTSISPRTSAFLGVFHRLSCYDTITIPIPPLKGTGVSHYTIIGGCCNKKHILEHTSQSSHLVLGIEKFPLQHWSIGGRGNTIRKLGQAPGFLFSSHSVGHCFKHGGNPGIIVGFGLGIGGRLDDTHFSYSGSTKLRCCQQCASLWHISFGLNDSQVTFNLISREGPPVEGDLRPDEL